SANQSVTGLQLSPDEKYVIANVVESPEGVKNTIVPNYVTESAFTEDISSRSKVGDTQSRSRLAILSVDTNEVKFVDHGQKQTPRGPEPRVEQTGATSGPNLDQAERPRRPTAADSERDVQLS